MLFLMSIYLFIYLLNAWVWIWNDWGHMWKFVIMSFIFECIYIYTQCLFWKFVGGKDWKWDPAVKNMIEIKKRGPEKYFECQIIEFWLLTHTKNLARAYIAFFYYYNFYSHKFEHFRTFKKATHGHTTITIKMHVPFDLALVLNQL